jgi:hypothetical protein
LKKNEDMSIVKKVRRPPVKILVNRVPASCGVIKRADGKKEVVVIGDYLGSLSSKVDFFSLEKLHWRSGKKLNLSCEILYHTIQAVTLSVSRFLSLARSLPSLHLFFYLCVFLSFKYLNDEAVPVYIKHGSPLPTWPYYLLLSPLDK